MKAIVIFGGIAVVVLFFFSLIFAIASSVDQTGTRLLTSLLLFIVGILIIAGIYFVTRKPKTIIQRLELSGKMKAASIRCPNCSASVDVNQIKIVSGVPYATCPYCGTTFEVTEEPKW